MNGIEMLVRDHRDLEKLFRQYEGAPDRDLVRRIGEALSAHAEVERTAFYPRLREGLPGGDPLADAALREHEEVEEILQRLENISGDDPALDGEMKILIQRVRRHVAEEESSLFLHLDERLPEPQLDELGEKIETERRLGPAAAAPVPPRRAERRARRSRRTSRRRPGAGLKR